jgi:hypothetical protein
VGKADEALYSVPIQGKALGLTHKYFNSPEKMYGANTLAYFAAKLVIEEKIMQHCHLWTELRTFYDRILRSHVKIQFAVCLTIIIYVHMIIIYILALDSLS